MEIAFAIFVVAASVMRSTAFSPSVLIWQRIGRAARSLAGQGAAGLDLHGAWNLGAVPRWIVILVVSRDIMIVSAVIVSWLFGKPIPMKPLMVSKLNTVAQVHSRHWCLRRSASASSQRRMILS